MPDTDPCEGASREPRGDSGLTEFLAIDPADAGLSREALSEAVRLLIRERDYLRNVREVQMAEARAQAEGLARDRDALRQERDGLLLDRDALREDRDAWRERARRAEDWLPRRLAGWVKRSLLGPFRRGR